MATMKITLPGASANTGVKASSGYPAGEYEFLIGEATWDDSKFASDEKYSLILKGVFTAAADDKLVGRKYTKYFDLRTSETCEDWMKENDMTDIVAVFNAAGLKIIKDVLPIDKLAGKTIGIELVNVESKKEAGKFYSNVKRIFAVAQE